MEEIEKEINLSDLLLILRKNWMLFAGSVLFCLIVAFIYLQWAPKSYTRTATVLIKDNSKGGAPSESAAFDEFNMFNIKSNVDNEVLVFQAKRLMKDVASRLRLDVSYTIREGIRTVELYTQSPVMVQFPDAEEHESFYFTVIPLSKEKVQLSGFSTENSEILTVNLKDTVNTPVGRLFVQPTLYYNETYFNKDIQ